MQRLEKWKRAQESIVYHEALLRTTNVNPRDRAENARTLANLKTEEERLRQKLIASGFSAEDFCPASAEAATTPPPEPVTTLPPAAVAASRKAYYGVDVGSALGTISPPSELISCRAAGLVGLFAGTGVALASSLPLGRSAAAPRRVGQEPFLAAL
jgi:hypothetical protein